MADSVQWAQELIHTRVNVGPKRLVAPGPNPEQLIAILEAACAAPDHGRLRPWRFVLVPVERRALLAQAFVDALLERDAAASADQQEAAREKAHRSPVLVLVIARLGGGEGAVDGDSSPRVGTPVHDHERLVTVGCAIQNILLTAHAMGFGSGITSGQAMQSRALHGLLALEPSEHAVCCINLGTVSKHKPSAPRLGLGLSLTVL